MQTTSPGRSEGAAAIGKVLDLAEFVAESPEGVTAAEISDRLGIPRPTVYRLVSALVGRGYLVSGPDRRLRIGLKFLQIGSRAPIAELIRQHGRPALWSLVATTSCASAQIAVLDRNVAVFVERASLPNASFKLDLHPGDEVPLYCTALGLALLAELPTAESDMILDNIDFVVRAPNTLTSKGAVKARLEAVRNQGFATSIVEFADDVWSVAAPIKLGAGAPQYAIGISEHMWRHAPDRVQDVARHVVAAAARATLLLTAPEGSADDHIRDEQS